jgi:ABC-type proline/glycine betaine transport system permease subunit
VVIYVNRSCSQFVKSIIGLIGILIDGFSSAIKYIKERLANIVIILKAWLFIKGLKVVRNVFKVSYS